MNATVFFTKWDLQYVSFENLSDTFLKKGQIFFYFEILYILKFILMGLSIWIQCIQAFLRKKTTLFDL